MSTSHRSGAVRYGLPGLAIGLALAWWGGGQGPVLRAQGSPASASEEKPQTIAFTTPSAGSSSQLLYVIDTKSQAFAIYRVDPSNSKGSGSVKLEAARQYRWDLKLSEFNNQPPEVHDVEAMVKSMVK